MKGRKKRSLRSSPRAQGWKVKYGWPITISNLAALGGCQVW
jgi:hypothetical protein